MAAKGNQGSGKGVTSAQAKALGKAAQGLSTAAKRTAARTYVSAANRSAPRGK